MASPPFCQFLRLHGRTHENRTLLVFRKTRASLNGFCEDLCGVRHWVWFVGGTLRQAVFDDSVMPLVWAACRLLRVVFVYALPWSLQAFPEPSENDPHLMVVASRLIFFVDSGIPIFAVKPPVVLCGFWQCRADLVSLFPLAARCLVCRQW